MKIGAHLLAVEVDGPDLVLRCSYCDPEWQRRFDGETGVLVGALSLAAADHHDQCHEGCYECGWHVAPGEGEHHGRSGPVHYRCITP
jgi:hypothetical protein